MGVRKCPKCGSVWYTALVNCAFCGVEGEEVKGPISPAKLNLSHGGVSTAPPPATPAAEAAPPPEPPPAPATPEPVPVPEAKEPASAPPEPPPARIEAPAPPPRAAARMESAAPRIPSATVPLVFGVLGIAAVLLLPLTAAFRNNRVVEILALLAWAILAPFAPFAWFTAERYLDRCRVLGFAPAPGAQTGKILGALSSFLLVFEFSALAVFIVIQALSGKINCPLWK